MGKAGKTKNPESVIKIKTFGFFNVYHNGESVFFGQNNAVKPLEILKFLIVNIGKEVSVDTIVENIWPDNEYYDEKTVIRTYIHRLRKIISAENRFNTDFSEDIKIFVSKGRYRLEISDRVDLDIDRLTELNYRASEALSGGNHDENPEQYASRLLNIYTGSFISDSPFAAWTLMYRNYYNRIYCNILNNILGAYYASGAYDKIIGLCEESMKIYDLDENTNLLFLNALIESGRPAVALQHYTYITSKMYTELNIAPSEKFLEIYNRIKTDRGVSPSGKKAPKPLLDGADFTDSEKIMTIINDLNEVARQIMSGIDKYSVGFVLLKPGSGVKNSDEDEEIRNTLEKSIRHALRKNDMYAIFSPFHAAIVLSGAQEEYYSIISKRLHEEFYKSYKGLDLILSVEISRVTTLR